MQSIIIRTLPQKRSLRLTWLSSVCKSERTYPILKRKSDRGMTARVSNCIKNCVVTIFVLSISAHPLGKSSSSSYTAIISNVINAEPISSERSIFLVLSIVMIKSQAVYGSEYFCPTSPHQYIQVHHQQRYHEQSPIVSRPCLSAFVRYKSWSCRPPSYWQGQG